MQPSFELERYQTARASAHTISPHRNETAELYNFQIFKNLTVEVWREITIPD